MLCQIGNCWEQATLKVWVDGIPFILPENENENGLFVCAKHGTQYAIQNPELVKMESLLKERGQ